MCDGSGFGRCHDADVRTSSIDCLPFFFAEALRASRFAARSARLAEAASFAASAFATRAF